jgi:acetyl/propionyl-CoA carboxylase alpha subunit
VRKLLIANRGEIACRVIRTARRLGWRTVAVYSDADVDAPHVAQAEEAVRIGEGPAPRSYLDIEALIAAARATGADALHPGYGFLSERADFAQACIDAGIVFVGPPPQAIRAMGDKAAAKRRMLEAGVPCAPGYLGEDQSAARMLDEARRVGVPLLVKAVAGGGGRGMRLVHDLAALPAALDGARREAESSFGDGTLMLEKLIEGGRHIEIQVFADAHGNIVHLFERDCTAQRRRQKVIEEAPSPIVDTPMRAAMGRDAVAAARAVGYVGAGTVEFMVDAERRHYFLEMNTRLQVEHPVTECITGVDLVEWQLRVAAGEPLQCTQDQIRMEGHAIEARLVAEDPYDGWKPQTGRVLAWRPEHAGVRVDHGIDEGQTITPYYDAMVAKFVAHGRDRADAVRRLTRALEDAPLFGVSNNGRFLRDLINHAEFGHSRLTTSRLDEWAAGGEALLQRPAPPESAWRIAAALLAPRAEHRPASVEFFDLELVCQGERRSMRAPLSDVTVVSIVDGHATVDLDRVKQRVACIVEGRRVHVAIDAAVFVFDEPSPYPTRDDRADPRRARSPVAGVVAQVLVSPGQRVEAGQMLASVESMKMEMWVQAGAPGTVRTVHATPKASVASGAVLVELDIDG